MSHHLTGGVFRARQAWGSPPFSGGRTSEEGARRGLSALVHDLEPSRLQHPESLAHHRVSSLSPHPSSTSHQGRANRQSAFPSNALVIDLDSRPAYESDEPHISPAGSPGERGTHGYGGTRRAAPSVTPPSRLSSPAVGSSYSPLAQEEHPRPSTAPQNVGTQDQTIRAARAALKINLDRLLRQPDDIQDRYAQESGASSSHPPVDAPRAQATEAPSTEDRPLQRQPDLSAASGRHAFRAPSQSSHTSSAYKVVRGPSARDLYG